MEEECDALGLLRGSREPQSPPDLLIPCLNIYSR